MMDSLGGSGGNTRTPGIRDTPIRQNRILIVEDEVLVALHLSEMLDELDYDVCGMAASGAEALDIAARERPALALVDIGLRGELDGIETAHALRNRFAVASLFMSGASDADTLERARAVGAAGFLPKPYGATELKATLEGIFRTGPQPARA